MNVDAPTHQTSEKHNPVKKAFRKAGDALPTGVKGAIVAVIGEFVGTFFVSTSTSDCSHTIDDLTMV
jgi:flagellar motor component MotA